MYIVKGSVVVSTAGHDKGVIFAVVGLVNGDYALIADGKVRKLEKPKKKKLKHLKLIGSLEHEIPMLTNRRLKSTLKSFDVRSGQGR